MFHNLNFYIFSDLVNLFLGLVIGFFVLLKNHKSPLNRNFSYFCFGVSFWAFGHMMWLLTSKTPEEAMFWLKFLMIGAALAPLFYFTFVIHFIHYYKKKVYFWHVIGAYILSTFFILVDVFSLELISGSRSILFFPYWPTNGSMFIPFLVFFFGYVIFASVLLARYYRQASNLEKIQIKFIFSGIVIAFIGGSTNYFLFFNATPIPPYLTILVSAYPVLIGYAITRYQFLSVQFILKRSLIYGITLIFSLIIFSLLILGLSDSFSNIWYQLLVVATLFLIWHFVPQILRFFLDRWWFSHDVDVTSVFSKIEAEMKAECQMECRLPKILKELYEKFDLQFVGGFLKDMKKDKEYRLFYPSTTYFTQVQYMDILRISQKFSNSLILTDEMPMKGRHDFYNTLRRSRVSILLKIREKELYEGILILGFKKDSTIWTSYELDALRETHRKIGTSLSWIILYDLAIYRMRKMGYKS